MTTDRVTLTVPARGEFAKVARMTAAALASRMGMSFDEVDDVRMAVEEAFVCAVDGMGSEGEITMRFALHDGTLSVNVCVGLNDAVADEDAERRAGLATFILDSVCDHYEFTSDTSGERWLHITTRAKEVDAD